jgi:broad specificity phosphatase PhoE
VRVATLVIRRHSLRKSTGGSQLSQQGVELARSVGATMGPFAVVATSVSPRARETALAMGFAVDQEAVTLGSDPDLYEESDESRWWEADQPFVALAKAVAAGGAYHLYAHRLAGLWRDLMTPLSNEDAALVIGHSGELEAGLVACLPDGDFASWGGPFGCCEGARLRFENHFTDVEILRLP